MVLEAGTRLNPREVESLEVIRKGGAGKGD